MPECGVRQYGGGIDTSAVLFAERVSDRDIRGGSRAAAGWTRGGDPARGCYLDSAGPEALAGASPTTAMTHIAIQESSMGSWWSGWSTSRQSSMKDGRTPAGCAFSELREHDRSGTRFRIFEDLGSHAIALSFLRVAAAE
jgi:hypothetical protein